MQDKQLDLLNITPDIWLTNEDEYRNELLKLPNWYQIPLINSNASHSLTGNKLVRFRGMIQDMHNPEFYFESFEIFNTVTNEVTKKSGKYRDTADVLEDEKINYSNLESAQRQTFVVISMPGLSDWAQEVENSKNCLKNLEQQPNTSKESDGKLKRSFEQYAEEQEPMEIAADNIALPNKQSKTDEAVNMDTNTLSREHLLNFPLPDVPCKSCFVKVYEDDSTLKLNDMVEVVGFLSIDPILSGEFHCESDSLIQLQAENKIEMITLNPPPSLIPRVHVVYVKKLNHCNPLVADNFDQDTVLKQAQVAREYLLKALTELLLGDKLAAEYLICHLISSIYLRQETLSLGQFCLNVSNLPIQHYPKYAKQLYDIIKQFVTKSYFLPMTLVNMNTMSLLPKKDYECNRLTSGVLQLSKDTHLVLDETEMEQGRLDATGVANISALGSLIKNQKVEYDFKYYKMEFDSDISVLILSEGKSLLPSDYHVPMRPELSSLEIFNAIVEAATYYLKEDIMNVIRVYLTNIKFVKYTINEDLQFVQDDFIVMRNRSTVENPVTANDLHKLLVLARLVSLSRGYDTLNKECWDIAMNMEKERLHREKNRNVNAF